MGPLSAAGTASFTAAAGAAAAAAGFWAAWGLSMGFMVGNRMTSRMEVLPVSSMTHRSMPMPMPPVGGIPYSSALMKSSSIMPASSSPRSRCSTCFSKRWRWSMGSFSSE